MTAFSADPAARIQELEARLAATRAELEQARSQLASAAVSRSHFLSNISHELRTPLTTIVGFSGVLLDRTSGPLSADQAKQLELIQSAGSQLLVLINDMVDLVNLESGAMEATRIPVDLRALLADLQMNLDDSLASLGVEVVTQGDPAVVESDAAKLRQILGGLVRCAMKASKQRRVDVTVRAGMAGVTVTVEDHGDPLPPEELEAVFDRLRQFSQGKRKTGSSMFKGAGLSLSVAAGLARLLGGTLSGQSLPGQGNRYTLSLPGRPLNLAAPHGTGG